MENTGATMTLTDCPVTDNRAASEGRIMCAGYCRMGQDYDCRCAYCNAGTYAAEAAAIKAWNLATAEHRAHVVRVTSAFACLANIGKAVFAALAPGLAVNVLAMWAAYAWGSSDGNIRGFYFRITGKRGKAAAHVGKVGVFDDLEEARQILMSMRIRMLASQAIRRGRAP